MNPGVYRLQDVDRAGSMDGQPGQMGLLAPGTKLAGRYVLVRTLGFGGMGFVYEIEHEAIGRRFALKVLRLDLSTEEDHKRFHREARALGRISSPRVAQVVDFGIELNVGPYYVMELLEGETLKDRLDREGRLRVETAVALAIELAEALAAVHDAGIVHRDLKPSNVGLSNDGPVAVKLLDFGLATSVEGGLLTRVTAGQELVGTLPYMAPEQFYDTPPSPSADLYAVGVILYEMLTGRLPFSASSPAAMIQEHLNAAPPPFDKALPGLKVPPWLEAIVLKLLSKDPASRYPGAVAVARALRQSERMSLESTVVSTPVAFQGGPPPARLTGLAEGSGPSGVITFDSCRLPEPSATSKVGMLITGMMLLGAALALALYVTLTPGGVLPGVPQPPARVETPPAPPAVLVSPILPEVTPPAEAAPAPLAPEPRKKSPAAAKKPSDETPWSGDLIDDPE